MTETEFCVPDHGSQAAIMAKLRALCEIRTFSGPLFELFRTFSRYVHCTKFVKNEEKLEHQFQNQVREMEVWSSLVWSYEAQLMQ